MTKLTEDYKTNIPLIIKLAKECYPDQPVLADMTWVQAILESNLYGRPSQLAYHYNNLFGIKGKGVTGKSIMLPTKEYLNGHWTTVKAAFAYNDSIEESLSQHKQLLNKDRYQHVREAKTFEEAATAIRVAGYATDPKYTNLLISVHNKYKGS